MSRLVRPALALAVTALVLVFLCPGRAVAGPVPGLNDFTVTTWAENDGLVASRITAIEQDANGFLWVGTDAALFRFDGVRFEQPREIAGYPVPQGHVTAILAARNRRLWIGFASGTLARIDDRSVTTYGRTDGLDGFVMSLREDQQGRLWAGTSRGFFRFDGTRWGQGAAEQQLGTSSVLAVHADRQGRLWVATPEAIFRRDPGEGRFHIAESRTLSSNYWHGFSEDAAGRLWMSDFREGFRHVTAAGSPSGRQGWGVQLLHDRRGNFWVATRGQGLWRVTQDAPGGRPLVEAITVKEGLASDAVQCVFEDREGNIWVGTHAGLQRLTPHRITPLNDLPIARALATTSDGSVWVGTAIGLTRFVSGRRRQYAEADGLPGTVVLTLHADARGVLWVATERGVARFDGERFSPILVPAGGRVQRVFSITSDGDDIWMRDVNSRLVRTGPNGEMREPAGIPEADRARAVALMADSRHRLWVGMTDGRVGVRTAAGGYEAHVPEIGSIAALYEDASGAIWIGGASGLSRYDGRRFVTVSGTNGFGTGVRSIVEDADGVLWIGTTTGIARVEKTAVDKAVEEPGRQIRYRLFTSADGAAGVPVTDGSPTAVRAANGDVWLATSGGVTVVDPRAIGEPRPPAPVRIETLTADATRFVPGGDLMLPPRTSNLQLAFTALTLTDSMRVQFRYRLDGFDTDWVQAGTTRQVSYTNLAPRHYRFQVAASNGDGRWSDPATVAFDISPTFYQQSWFYAVCAAVLGSAVYGAWQLRVRRVRSEFALVLAERIRMSRAIHDTLLQGLAALALQLDDLSHTMNDGPVSVRDRVLGMRRRVEDYIREARQSIWDLRSSVLDARALPDALRDTGRRVVADRPVALDLTVKGNPKPCSPAVQEQLLLICQEALSNAVQHAHPRRVDIELEYRDTDLRVRVTDDGCGFDPDAVERANGHYGMLSMQERAAQVRGRITVASSPGKGTLVEAVLPSS